MKKTFVLILSSLSFASARAQSVELITFPGTNSKFVRAKSVADLLGLTVAYERGQLFLNNVRMSQTARLFDGTMLVEKDSLSEVGVAVTEELDRRTSILTLGDKWVVATTGRKSVLIDLATQRLTATQGDMVILASPVSTGRFQGSTPTGSFLVGPTKEVMHRSSLYNNAPMPYSVQVSGNIFIHGYASVPDRPASHGCIRMPIPAAKWFFDWVEVGTPVAISGRWSGKSLGNSDASD